MSPGPGPTDRGPDAERARVGHNGRMSGEKRRLPPWLLGLIAAAVIFVVVLVLMNSLGYGDDPVLGS